MIASLSSTLDIRIIPIIAHIGHKTHIWSTWIGWNGTILLWRCGRPRTRSQFPTAASHLY